MNKQNLYVAFLNALLGVVLSLLLKGNLLIYVLTLVIVLTIIFIERRWIYEKVFQRKKWRAMLGYTVMLLAMVGFLLLITEPNRDISLIVSSTHHFLDHLQPGEYEQAYQALSEVSKKNYPEKDFVSDHENLHIKVQDFRIDEVALNNFDKKKAAVRVSSPFSLYGQNSFTLEVVNENGAWRVVINPSMIDHKTSLAETTREPARGKNLEKRRPGAVTRFFRKIF